MCEAGAERNLHGATERCEATRSAAKRHEALRSDTKHATRSREDVRPTMGPGGAQMLLRLEVLVVHTARMYTRSAPTRGGKAADGKAADGKAANRCEGRTPTHSGRTRPWKSSGEVGVGRRKVDGTGGAASCRRPGVTMRGRKCMTFSVCCMW